MDIIWRSKHFNQYFLCMRWSFSRSFKSFSLPYPIINFLIASLKFWKCLLNPPQYSLLCDWSMFSSTDLSLAEVKCARNNLSQAASGMISQNHRRLPVSIFRDKIAALGFLKRFQGGIQNYSVVSKEQAETWCLIFSSTNQRMYRKYQFIIINLQKKYSSRDTIPLTYEYVLF
jgi:hypothetical protein